MVTNFVNNQNSSKNQINPPASFDIRNFTDQLEPAKEKNKYICPVCDGHNLSIDEKTGKYQCFNGCECRDIREAIKPWDSVLSERKQNNTVSPKKPKAQKPHNQPVPIPAGELALARLNEIPTDIPLPTKPHFVHDSVTETLLKKGVTAKELEQITVTTYDYGDKKYSHRYQTSSNANSKGYEKTFSISRIDSTGKTQRNKGDSAWGAYRLDEAIAQIKAIPAELIPVLLSHEGEKCVEAGRAEKLAGITSVGNSSEKELIYILNDIKSKLDGRQFILAHCQDNDKTGHTKANKLRRACEQVKIPYLAIDLKAIIPDLCDKGDIVDILATGMTGDELEKLILSQIESTRNSTKNNQPPTSETQWHSERNNWKAPVSHNGEIGFWKSDDDGNYFFEPACNFDFQVEREIEDADGGGLVLQVKRSFENRQIRIIINSIDYTQPDKFTDALKRALKAGIVCNLNKAQLNALIHTRLQEYRTTRQGRIFKRIDRYGQQSDGTWVFSDRQYKKDGTPTNENESGWVFNPSLGKDDFIPCPELAEENPQALKMLVEASRKFFGQQNINQVLLTMGWVVAGLNFQEIFSQNNCFPLFDSYGEAGSCKTLGAETALSLVGKNWAEHGMLARVSISALYEHGARTGSLPFFWDDPARNPENEELFKNWYNSKPRRVRGNQQTPHSPMGATSNHILGGEQAATYTRFVRVAYERIDGDKAAFQELKASWLTASGAFPQLIALGYPRQEIAQIEADLLQYLPHAHARIAQSLAIATWYAQKLVEMTGGFEDVKQWVIDNCCKSENDADANGDSLKDFLAKIQALEAESLIGDWNFKRNVERNGQQFYAIYAHDAWKLVDQRFKPATYNERSLKSLVLKAGGVTDTTVRFSCDRDLVLAYNRALLNPRELSGVKIYPEPPKTVPRKAWLIPAALFGEMDFDVAVTTVTERNRNPVTASNPDETSTFDPQNPHCNCVTEKNELKEKKEEEKEDGSLEISTQEKNLIRNQNSGYTGYTPLSHQKTEENQGFQGVTENQISSVTLGYTVTEQIPSTYSPSPNDPDDVAGCAENIRAAITEMSGEMVELLAQNWSPEFKQAVLNQLSKEDKNTVEHLAPGAFPKKTAKKLTRINPENLPTPTFEQIKIGTKVWVYNLRAWEWLPGVIEEIEERFNKPELWFVRLTDGKKTMARSLEKLRLR